MATTNPSRNHTRLFLAVALVATGLFLAAFGNAWAPLVFEWLPARPLGAWLELIVPFLPMAFIGLGAALWAVGTPGTRRAAASNSQTEQP